MNKSIRTIENGRSMVEMLGISAVIGVLSVAGISAYTTAMNKHRANEILNEASKRAIVVASQIAAGRTPTLTEFTDNTVGGATFSQEVESIGNQFKIKFTTSPNPAVQTKMKNIAGTKGLMAVAEDDGGLTFNNDLSSIASGGNTDNPAGSSTEGGEDVCSLKASDCLSGALAEGECTCAPAEEDVKCTSWTDKSCGKGKYCQFSPTSGGCTEPTEGVCKDISSCGLYDVGETGWVASDYSGSCSPDWWTAQSICASVGVKTPSLSIVGCEEYRGNNCPTSGTVYGELREAGLKYSFWTKDLFDSCSAWLVNGIDGVNSLYRSLNFDVLCQ